MAVTYRTSNAGGGSSGTGNRSATISALTGDLLIVYVQWSANSATNPTCTDSGDAGAGAYALLGTAFNNASRDIQAVFARTTAVVNNATLTVTPVVGSGNNTAGEIVIIACAGATNFGASAIRSGQFGKQANQTSGVPTPVLPSAALTGNMTIMSSGSSGTGTLTAVPNASWVERQDAQQASPVTALEVNTRNSGFTGTSAAYVSIVSALWNSTIIELDGAVNVTVNPTGPSGTSSVGSVSVTGTASFTPTGSAATSSVGTISVTGTASFTPTGSSVASSVGSVSITGNANVSPTGSAAVSAVGTVTVTTTSPDVTVNITGNIATSSVGSVSEIADANIFSTGNIATSAVGTVSIQTSVSVSITENSVASSVGSVSITANASVSVIGGVSASSSGAIVGTGTASVTPTGSQANATASSVSVQGTASFSPSGNIATSFVGDVTVTIGGGSTDVVVNVTGNIFLASLGSISVQGNANVSIFGSTNSISAGSVFTIDDNNTVVFAAGNSSIFSVHGVTPDIHPNDIDLINAASPLCPYIQVNNPIVPVLADFIENEDMLLSEDIRFAGALSLVRYQRAFDATWRNHWILTGRPVVPSHIDALLSRKSAADSTFAYLISRANKFLDEL